MSHQELHDDAVRTLAAWSAPTPDQNALRHAFLGFLAAREDATARACVPGHLTASAVVLSADRSEVLLTLHPRVGRWLQLGGHCEDFDHTVAGAALREATEESGIEGLTLDPVPIHLDVHPITCSLGLPTLHFDVRYMILAPVGAVPVISAESQDLKFVSVADLPDRTDRSADAAVKAALGHTA